MILQHSILNVFLIAFATSAVVDHEPPVFTCPDDIVIDDATTSEVRVTWDRPTATDNSGEPPSIICSRQSGGLFSVPGSYEVQCRAVDGAGNKATCSLRITLKFKTCRLYTPPKNGALACFKASADRSCVVMCKSSFDFVFSPPLLYYCSSGQWHFYSMRGLPCSSQLPWPNCAAYANPSPSKMPQFYFFDGDASNPNVQNTIKTNYINLMKYGYFPPYFCLSDQCTKDNIEVYAGSSKV